MKTLSKLKAQSILEYSVLVGCIVAAFVAMQIYVKRGVEGRLKQTADDIGEQYAPENTTTDITTNLTSTQNQETKIVPLTYPSDYQDVNLRGKPILDDNGFPVYGTQTTITINDETMTRSGSEKLGKFEDKLFQ